jgi:hypothetical protein
LPIRLRNAALTRSVRCGDPPQKRNVFGHPILWLIEKRNASMRAVVHEVVGRKRHGRRPFPPLSRGLRACSCPAVPGLPPRVPPPPPAPSTTPPPPLPLPLPPSPPSLYFLPLRPLSTRSSATVVHEVMRAVVHEVVGRRRHGRRPFPPLSSGLRACSCPGVARAPATRRGMNGRTSNHTPSLYPPHLYFTFLYFTYLIFPYSISAGPRHASRSEWTYQQSHSDRATSASRG